MITLLAKLLKVLNAEASPGQISAALCLAMFFAFMPMITLQHVLLLLLVLVLRVNITGFILGWLVFSVLSFLLDPLFHWLGMAVLSADGLSGFWSLLYGSGFWHLTRFNNTIVMGGLILSLVCVLPVYFGCNALIRRYRTHVMTWIEKTRIAQMVKGSRIYSAYKTVSGWRGAV
ncbi:MAG: TIGR03546 family protein [Desulfobacterales bacterium]|nr:TIGR03546 family protein [Desulfobacterales bacterium]